MGDPITALKGILAVMNDPQVDPYAKLRKDTGAQETLKKISAINLARTRLNDNLAEKQKYDESPDWQERMGANTGPYMGEWKVGSQYDDKGQGTPPGHISNLMSLLMPRGSKAKARMQSQLREFEQTAFEFGGKQLTGRELAATVGAWPTIHHDDADYMEVGKRWLNEAAPKYLENMVQFLINRDHDPKVIRDFILKQQGGIK